MNSGVLSSRFSLCPWEFWPLCFSLYVEQVRPFDFSVCFLPCGLSAWFPDCKVSLLIYWDSFVSRPSLWNLINPSRTSSFHLTNKLLKFCPFYCMTCFIKRLLLILNFAVFARVSWVWHQSLTSFIIVSVSFLVLFTAGLLGSLGSWFDPIDIQCWRLTLLTNGPHRPFTHCFSAFWIIKATVRWKWIQQVMGTSPIT